MTMHDPERDVPEEPDPEQPEQPADPFEPEAPAHVDPDEETIVHAHDGDEEAAVDEADPAPEQPASGDGPLS